jgi:ABC-2 type transport system permease protein
MSGIVSVWRRELASYFSTPVAYVFLLVFLMAAAACTFYLGRFYEGGVATLSSFFGYHAVLFLFLVPALSMRLWSEERKSGSIELLMTLPIEVWQAVVGKYFAAWAFTALAIALTFPIWITVNYLGAPDNGAIAAAYVGSVLMAGGFLAIGSFLSAFTKNQVIAFVLSALACFLVLVAGYDLVLDAFSSWAPQAVVDAVASLSFLTHFESISKGVIDVRDLVYFALLIAACLYANVIVLHLKKGD